MYTYILFTKNVIFVSIKKKKKNSNHKGKVLFRELNFTCKRESEFNICFGISLLRKKLMEFEF